MYTFLVKLYPKNGVGGTLTTEVRASSEIQARLLLEPQYPNHRVEVVQRLS